MLTFIWFEFRAMTGDILAAVVLAIFMPYVEIWTKAKANLGDRNDV